MPDLNFAHGIAEVDRSNRPSFLTDHSASPHLNHAFEDFAKKQKFALEWVPTSQLRFNTGGIDCLTLHE